MLQLNIVCFQFVKGKATGDQHSIPIFGGFPLVMEVKKNINIRFFPLQKLISYY